MAKDDNTAGWILTTLVYTLGGRMEKGTGKKRRRDAEQPADGHGAEHAQADAVDRQLDGLELRLRLERHQPGVRRRQRRHVHQRLGRLHEPRPGVEHRSVDLRARALPIAKNKNAGVLGGGTEVAVKPTANAAEKAAALKWIDFFYERPLVTKARAVQNAKTLVGEQAAGRRAGAATLQQAAVRPREHLDQAVHQRAARTDEAVPTDIFRQRLIPEPAASTQSVYHALDPVVRSGADGSEREHPVSCSTQANRTAQAAISRGK